MVNEFALRSWYTASVVEAMEASAISAVFFTAALLRFVVGVETVNSKKKIDVKKL